MKNNLMPLPQIIVPDGFHSVVGQAARKVSQTGTDGKPREVEVKTNTITLVVQRTKPVQESQIPGRVFGYAAAAAGPKKIVNVVAYDGMAAQVAALKRGDMVVFDGRVKYEEGEVYGTTRMFFYPDAMRVLGNINPGRNPLPWPAPPRSNPQQPTQRRGK
jgi:hypothetical protein